MSHDSSSVRIEVYSSGKTHWLLKLVFFICKCAGILLTSIYHMVGNFHEGFLFAFFVSQEPFTKIKTVKFLLATCKVNEPRFNQAYFKLSSRSN